MNQFHEAASFIRMVEEGTVANSKQVERRYGYSKDKLISMVRNGDLSTPVKRLSTYWYLVEEIELFQLYSDEEE